MSGMGGIVTTRTLGALEQTAAFTEARQKVLAENVANVDTPNYQRKRVNLEDFQQALAAALRQRGDEPLAPIVTEQVQRDETGAMVLRPALEPADNVTFHDGTNGRIEREMTEMSRNLLLHQVSVDMIRRHYRMMEMAIRGRVL